jgi:hypothetical protein
VALRLGPIRIPWPGKNPHRDDPYWGFFINTPPADLANTVTDLIRNAPEGNVFPTKADIHTPEITSSHVKEMARYFGADLVGIAKLNLADASSYAHLPGAVKGKREAAEDVPFGVICAVRAEHDPRHAPGIGGQVPAQNGLFITFVLSAWIRELGFRATAIEMAHAEALAAQAGLGKLDAEGRLVVGKFGTHVHVAPVICTDLPLVADG